ncbi:MAG: acetoacetate decarboxylase family protein [bacterium]|nr:acetoacetate decarboxylase family protein [bacterium]
MKNSNFFDVTTSSHDTSAGPIQIPSLYRDSSMVTAMFLCECDRVAGKLEGTGLVPAKFLKGKALAILSFYEYRDTTFGPYNEMSFMVLVYPGSSVPKWPASFEFFRKASNRSLGYFFLDLPLTANLPLVAGIELWGLPKFITDVSFQCSEGMFEGKIPDPETGEDIVTLKAPFGRGVTMPPMDMAYYSTYEGSLMKTIVNLGSPAKMTSGKGVEITVGPSRHAMTDNLRDLDLDGAKPIMVQTCDRFIYRLNQGEPIGQQPVKS